MNRPKKTRARKTRTRLLLLLGLAALAGAGWFSWRWLHTIPLREVTIVGLGEADSVRVAEVLTLAAVDTSRALYTLDADLVADRAARHPWVAAAAVRRLPTGTLQVVVKERRPVALAVGSDGVPSHYLDAGGYMMPFAVGQAFDVPLVRALDEPYHPMRQVEHPALREMLAAWPALPASARALISEVSVRGDELWALTPPAGGRTPIPVRLGRDALAARLARLDAFWHQAVRTRPGHAFALIDLRFSSQIVTEEAAVGY